MGYVANTLPYFAYTHRCKQNTLVCYQNTPWAVTPLSCNTPRAFFFNSAFFLVPEAAAYDDSGNITAIEISLLNVLLCKNVYGSAACLLSFCLFYNTLLKNGVTATHLGVFVCMFKYNTPLGCSRNRSGVLRPTPLKCSQYTYWVLKQVTISRIFTVN